MPPTTARNINWVDKYRDSGHHVDRLVRTIVKYEDSTGLNFAGLIHPVVKKPEKEMVVLTEYRRYPTTAVSLPADDIDLADVAGYSRAIAFSNNAFNHNAAALSAASKRHDQELLDDIANKMAYTAPAATSPIIYGTSSSYYKKSPATSGRVRHSMALPHYVNPLDQANGVIPPYIPAQISTRSVRSGSVPPRTTTYHYGVGSVPKWSPASTYNVVSDLSKEVDNDVVGVAHTSRLGDIVIGIPYRKKYMFDAQYEPFDDVLDDYSVHTHNVHKPISKSYAPKLNLGIDDDLDFDYATMHTEFRTRAMPPRSRYSVASVPSSHYKPTRSAPSPTSTHVNDYITPMTATGTSAGYGTSAPVIPEKAKRPPVSDTRKKIRNLLCKSHNDPHYFD